MSKSSNRRAATSRERKKARHIAHLATVAANARASETRRVENRERVRAIATQRVETLIDRLESIGSDAVRRDSALRHLGFGRGWAPIDAARPFSLVTSPEKPTREPYAALNVAAIRPEWHAIARYCDFVAERCGFVMHNANESRTRTRGVSFKVLAPAADGIASGARVRAVNPSQFGRVGVAALDLADGAVARIAIDDTPPGYGEHVDHGVRDPRSAQIIATKVFTGDNSRAHLRRKARVKAAWGPDIDPSLSWAANRPIAQAVARYCPMLAASIRR